MSEAERMKNSSIRGVKDIRCQWTTYEELNQWFDDAKSVLLKYKFTEDRNTGDEDLPYIRHMGSRLCHIVTFSYHMFSYGNFHCFEVTIWHDISSFFVK